MLAGGPTEAIWYFAGYLKLIEEIKAARLDYAGEADEVSFSPWQPEAPALASVLSPQDEIAGSKSLGNVRISPRNESPAIVPANDVEAYMIATASPAVQATTAMATPAREPTSDASITSIFTRSSEPPAYEIFFGEGGSGRFVEITQTNFMLDLDAMLSIYTVLPSISQADQLTEMLDLAKTSVAEHFTFPSGGIKGWTSMLREDAATRTEDEEAVGSMVPGRHVNGSLVEDPREGALNKLPDLPPAGGGASGLDDVLQTTALETGGNVSVNQALIADLNEASRTFAVQGDVFVSNSIVQSIVYRDSDKIWHDPGAHVQSLGNTIDNDAIFEQRDPLFAQAAGISGNGLSVRVDLLDGDLIDIKTIVQRNMIADGDVVSQWGSEYSSSIATGSNWQVNSSQLFDAAQYDLIVVLGDFYALNSIVQIAILIDDDVVISSSDGNDGTSSKIVTGDNSISNQAKIEQIAADWTKMPVDFAALVALLAAGEDPGLSAWSQISGSATGALDVLIVRGDYYSINAIYQLNVVIDDDLVMQRLEGTGPVSTGGNHLVNDARIVDLGGLSNQFVGGNVYEDAMLMQASLAYGDDATTTVINGDTETLASEFVAFVSAEGAIGGNSQDDPLFSGFSHDAVGEFGSLMV